QQTVKDHNNKAYSAQFMVTLQHPQNIHEASTPGNYTISDVKQKMIVPGKDWLYFEIYCHPNRTDELLTKVLIKFIKKFKPAFTCWYFIRYNDPTNHIRLRFRMKDIAMTHLYTSKLINYLNAY